MRLGLSACLKPRMMNWMAHIMIGVVEALLWDERMSGVHTLSKYLSEPGLSPPLNLE